VILISGGKKMKRLVGVLVTVLILYSIYYDLRYGTLPAAIHEQKPEVETIDTGEMPYFEKTIENGDTVLTIIENQLGQSLPVPISVVVTDFKKLNQDLPPQQIQPGKTYKFPNYRQDE
jgi:hypothetical protein